MFRLLRLATVVFALALIPLNALANVLHIVRQGDTVTSLSQEYYGDTKLAVLLRAVNRMPNEGEVALAIGEPLMIPECRRRIVKESETWRDLAEAELGNDDRDWFLAKLNNSAENVAPAKGQIVTVPYLMSWSLTEGLAATIVQFFPDQDQRGRIATARMLIRLNKGLRPRGTAKGTRIVIPFSDVNILPQKLAEIEREKAAYRSTQDQRQQQDANSELEQLAVLLSSGSYVELVRLAGRISATDLTEAQHVTLHRYLGQAFAALDRPDLAVEEFADLLELQPDFQFDQVTTSPAILELLDRARRPSQTKASKQPVNGR